MLRSHPDDLLLERIFLFKGLLYLAAFSSLQNYQSAPSSLLEAVVLPLPLHPEVSVPPRAPPGLLAATLCSAHLIIIPFWSSYPSPASLLHLLLPPFPAPPASSCAPHFLSFLFMGLAICSMVPPHSPHLSLPSPLPFFFTLGFH